MLDRLIARLRGLWMEFWRSDFRRGLRLSLIAVHAMLLRDASTRFGQRSAGAVWVIIAPLLRLGGMILLFSFLQRGPAAGDSLVIFFMTGMVPVFLIRNAVTSSGAAIRSSAALLSYPHISALEVVAARVWIEVIADIVVIAVIAFGAKAFVGLEIAAWISEPLELICAMIMLVYFVYAVSFLSAQIGRMWQQWTDISRFMARAIFFTSGVWFTMGSLPPEMREIVKYNPVAHVIEWIRDASIHGFESDLFSVSYPFWFATVCLFIGLFINWLYRLGGYDMEPGR